MTRDWDLLYYLWACRGGRTEGIEHTEENWREMRKWHLRRLKRRAMVEQARMKAIQHAQSLPTAKMWNRFARSSFRVTRAMTAYEKIAGANTLMRIMNRIWGKTTKTAKPSQQSLEI